MFRLNWGRGPERVQEGLALSFCVAVGLATATVPRSVSCGGDGGHVDGISKGGECRCDTGEATAVAWVNGVRDRGALPLLRWRVVALCVSVGNVAHAQSRTIGQHGSFSRNFHFKR
jgi:hypothetical protein